MHSGHARDGAQRISLGQSRYNRLAFIRAQFVHVGSVLDRSSTVKDEMMAFATIL
jgi:hypothetical protein